MESVLEQFLAQVNANVFLREFSFAHNLFEGALGSEVEVADHILLLPQAVFVFEVKERRAEGPDTNSSIESWFRRKVLDKACGQLANTERFLRTESNIELPNQRGHIHDFADNSVPLVKVAIYSTGPEFIAHQMHKASSRAGFVHLLHINDYCQVCRLLVLPSEVASYFAFRETFLKEHPGWPHGESSLLASFVNEEDMSGATFGDEAGNLLEEVQRDNPSLDIGNILRKFGGKVQYANGCGSDNDYYAILREFAHMNRRHVRDFRNLLNWALTVEGNAVPETPVRMLVEPRHTGFVLFPVPRARLHVRLNALQNFTVLCKYEWKLVRQIGLSVAREGGEVLLDWAFSEHPWVEDSELERQLEEHYPFRPTPQPTGDFRFRFGGAG
jgi:hypothetical protein